MYGSLVHAAVIAAKEKETGITVHYVDELYDHGQVIFQASVPVDASDTPESLARKVHELEYEHFPGVIASVLDLQK
jgi:phosphoribosylglycinamide formyltransferase 1